MTDTARLRTALAALQTALEAVDLPSARTELRLAISMLAGAVSRAGEGVNAAAVNDIEFALNDLVTAAGELTGAEAEQMDSALRTLQDEVATLRAATQLPPAVVGSIRALQAKLRIRRSGIERQTFLENVTQPLPHDPEELRRDAVLLRDHLAAAGFSTPALDNLIADPASIRFHSLGEIADELDVIAG